MFTNKNSNTYFTVAFAIKSSPSIELIKRIHTITLDCSASSRIRTSMDFSTLSIEYASTNSAKLAYATAIKITVAKLIFYLDLLFKPLFSSVIYTVIFAQCIYNHTVIPEFTRNFGYYLSKDSLAVF